MSNWPQLRIISAVPGQVEFELDIKKDHTVMSSPAQPPTIYNSYKKLADWIESIKYNSWRNNCIHG